MNNNINQNNNQNKNHNKNKVTNDNIPTDYYIKDGIINIYYLYKLVRRKNTYDIDNFEESVINNTLQKYYLKTEGTLKWVKIKRIYLLAKLLIYYSKYLAKIGISSVRSLKFGILIGTTFNLWNKSSLNFFS